MSNEIEHDFRTEVNIDRFNLEMEASKQASLYQYWSEQLADAKLAKDKQEIVLKVRNGEIEMEIRKFPPEGIKITESVISALLNSNIELINMENSLAIQKHRVAVLESGVRAFEQKKSQIETLSKLWIAGYYSAPNKGDSEDSMNHRRALNSNKHSRGMEEEA